MLNSITNDRRVRLSERYVNEITTRVLSRPERSIIFG